jgi:hypothetical protein
MSGLAAKAGTDAMDGGDGGDDWRPEGGADRAPTMWLGVSSSGEAAAGAVAGATGGVRLGRYTASVAPEEGMAGTTRVEGTDTDAWVEGRDLPLSVAAARASAGADAAPDDAEGVDRTTVVGASKWPFSWFQTRYTMDTSSTNLRTATFFTHPRRSVTHQCQAARPRASPQNILQRNIAPKTRGTGSRRQRRRAAAPPR